MSLYGITYFRIFVLVIKISVIRICLGLVRLLFGGFRYSDLSAAAASAKVDLGFFAEKMRLILNIINYDTRG